MTYRRAGRGGGENGGGWYWWDVSDGFESSLQRILWTIHAFPTKKRTKFSRLEVQVQEGN